MEQITYRPDKVKFKDFYGLEVTDYLIPFQLPDEDDEDKELVVTLVVGDEDRVLELDTNYYIDRSSILRVDNTSLGLTREDPLSLSLEIHINETTTP